MEFAFSINSFFPHAISKITSDDMKIRTEPCLQRAIDDIGRASQIAQNLRRAVTSTTSFIGSNQVLYIMTNPSENSGKGAVLGMLKVGTKKLFLIDKAGSQNELNPMCILDFYIHESSQRMGFGKILFDHFLKDYDTHPVQVAIDRPSDKFTGFLKKHYGLVSMIPQVNNFVIYEGFFETLEMDNKSSRLNSPFLSSPGTGVYHNKLPHRNSLTDQAQSLKSCLYDSSKSEDALWQNHMHKATEKSCSESNPDIPTKFSHHRLW